MLITHPLTPAQMLSELFGLARRRGYRPVDTERFASLKHDADLCSGFEARLTVMLEAYARHHTDVHDIQGFRDSGVDVLTTFADGDRAPGRIGLQIKSQDEVSRGGDRFRTLVGKLKTQCAEAWADARVDPLYVVLCCDELRCKEQIRSIGRELKNFDRVKIIKPMEALALLEMRDDAIEGFVTRLLCQGDPAVRAAQENIEALGPKTSYFVLALLEKALLDNVLWLNDETPLDIDLEWDGYLDDLDPDGVDPALDRKPPEDVLGDLECGGLNAESGGGYRIMTSDLPSGLHRFYVACGAADGFPRADEVASRLGLIAPRRTSLRGPRRENAQ